MRDLQAVLNQVIWISLEELGQQDEIDPLLNLLTLPVLVEPELQRSSQQIIQRRPDLAPTVLPLLTQRHPHFTLLLSCVFERGADCLVKHEETRKD